MQNLHVGDVKRKLETYVSDNRKNV